MNILSGLVNLIRILSLTRMLVFIETIDEKLICATLRVVTVIAGVTACAAQVLSGDVFTGTHFNIVTRSKIQEGKKKYWNI